MSEQSSENVVVLKPKQATRASERKWGRAVMDLGFCILPSLLVRAQERLKLTPTQLAILLHLADFWWDADRKPFPTKGLLASRMGLSSRQIQRYMAELEEAGYLKRVERKAAHRGKIANEYDLSGLVRRLNELAPEFRQVEDENKERRRSVAKAGLRTRIKAPE